MHSPISFEPLVLGPSVFGQSRRVVDHLGIAAEDRTPLTCMVTDSDYIIEYQIGEIIYLLRGMLGDVYTGLGHNFYGIRVQPSCFDPCRVGVYFIALQMTCPAIWLRHELPA